MKNILHKISKNIWAYVLWIVIAFLVWATIFGYLTRIKTTEKVCVFIGSRYSGFEKSEELNNKRPGYLKKVEVRAYSINDRGFARCLSVFGYETGDILILPESYLNEESCPQNFALISEAYCLQFANKGFYTVNDKAYGICVHEKGKTESLISCINYGEGDDEENYYLLFNIRSQHLSDLSDESKISAMDGAIKIAQELLIL